jgi:hypothetical protein
MNVSVEGAVLPKNASSNSEIDDAAKRLGLLK